jgi:RNA polymerase sigma-70 factor (ECF subfamily)
LARPIRHRGKQATEFQRDEELQLLSMAMDRLPEDKREILLLSKYQDKKYKRDRRDTGLFRRRVKVKVFSGPAGIKDGYMQN